jgi:hypothetical protein
VKLPKLSNKNKRNIRVFVKSSLVHPQLDLSFHFHPWFWVVYKVYQMGTKLGNWGLISKKWGPNEFLEGILVAPKNCCFFMFEGFSRVYVGLKNIPILNSLFGFFFIWFFFSLYIFMVSIFSSYFLFHLSSLFATFFFCFFLFLFKQWFLFQVLVLH